MVFEDGFCSIRTILPSTFFRTISGCISCLSMDTCSCAMSASSRDPLTEDLLHTLSGLRFTTLFIDDIRCSIPTLCRYVSSASDGSSQSEDCSLNHPHLSPASSLAADMTSSSSQGLSFICTSNDLIITS